MDREQTLTGLIHPETIGGHQVWSDSGTSAGALADKLKYGDPTRGWPGDERLALVLNSDAGLWEVWRLDHNTYHLVARRSTAVPLDERVIDHIMAHDTRRRDVIGEMIAHNAKLDRERDQRRDEQITEMVDQFAATVRRSGV